VDILQQTPIVQILGGIIDQREQDVADNVKTVTIEVKEPSK
jgi:hypothetical protein